jgi:hypothetical protein
MNRDEREQLRAITDEVSGWIEAAGAIRAQRTEARKAAKAAEAALRRVVVEVRRNDEVAWRVLPLTAKAGVSLRDIAGHANLPAVPKILDEALVNLTTDVSAAVDAVQVIAGARRFFSRSSSRDKGRDAGEYVTDYRKWFRSNGLPDALNHLFAQGGKAPTMIAVSDALADRVGLAPRLSDLGRPGEVLGAKAFKGLAEATRKVQGAAAEEARCRSAAVDAGNNIRRAETERMLAAMAVDRLKEATRDKIRTAPLAEAGLTTVKAVLAYRGLQNLAGIGATSATRIRGAARTLWQTTYDEMPARIDIKSRTAEATELLRRLQVWDAVRKNLGGAADLDLAQELSGLAKAVGGMVTHAVIFCAPNSSVQDFRTSADAIVQRARVISDAGEPAKGRDPWDDFLSRPADYFALLAELGFITEDAEKTHGDLPDDIVDAVRALELRTEYLSASLRGYQSFGARFALVQRKVIIGDEMGLGKTVEAIAVFAHLRAKGSHHFLVVCPASVVTNWIREVASKSTLAAHRLHGPDREWAAKHWRRAGGVAVTTFDTLTWLHDNVTGLDDLGCVVIDEAHYIKNPEALRTRNSMRLVNKCERAALLTGTPLENRIDEFSNLVSYLQPKLVVDADELAPRKFRRQVAPAYLRRNQEDVLTELPELVEVDEWLTLSAEDSAAYRTAVSAGNFMAMRQAAMTQSSKSRKVQRLVEIVEEAEDNGRRVIVFSYFRDVLDKVARNLPGRVFGPLTGSVPPAKRQTMVDEFSAAGHGAVLVAQVVAGGVGLNIQAASVVVICEPQLKPTTEWQAIARARRMGQLESVQVHRLLSEEGVDQRIREILARKSQLFDEFARISETAGSAPEAVDVSEAELAREVIAAERERLFAQPQPAGGRHSTDAEGVAEVDRRRHSEAAAPHQGQHHRVSVPADDGIDRPVQQDTSPPVSAGGRHEARAEHEGRTSDESVSVSARLTNIDSVSPAGSSPLQPYAIFDESLPAIHTTPLSVIAANVARIVKAEGPILGWRLHDVYRKASVGREPQEGFSRILNRAITLAERRRLIVSDNPFKQEGIKPKTFRLPSQPKVLARQLGPRTVDVVPPAELAHHFADLATTGGAASEEELFQNVQELLGLTQLTDNARAVLEATRELAVTENEENVQRPKQVAPESRRVGSDPEPKRPKVAEPKQIKAAPRDTGRPRGTPPARSPFYDVDFVKQHEWKW